VRETWLLALREERRLRVFKNRVPGVIFRSRRDEVTGEWKKLHVARMRERRDVF